MWSCGCCAEGPKRQLADTVHQNAAEALTRHRLRRASDHNTRARALNELETALELPDAPLRIECYDMSHLQGTDYVGSMVVLEDGLPASPNTASSGSRGWRATTTSQPCERCSTAGSALPGRPGSPRSGTSKFSYPPQLLLVDGGKGQLGVATGVLEELGLYRADPGGLAREAIRAGVPARAPLTPSRCPGVLRRCSCCSGSGTSPIGSRSATTAKLRGKRMLLSELDDVTGLGPRRRERLIEHFGSVPKLRSAALEGPARAVLAAQRCGRSGLRTAPTAPPAESVSGREPLPVDPIRCCDGPLLRFFGGTMGSGKSTLALQIHHNLSRTGLDGVLVSRLDREGSVVSSRLGVSRAERSRPARKWTSRSWWCRGEVSTTWSATRPSSSNRNRSNNWRAHR